MIHEVARESSFNVEPDIRNKTEQLKNTNTLTDNQELLTKINKIKKKLEARLRSVDETLPSLVLLFHFVFDSLLCYSTFVVKC